MRQNFLKIYKFMHIPKLKVMWCYELKIVMLTAQKYFLKSLNGASALRHFHSRVTTPSPKYGNRHVIGQQMYNLTRSLSVLAYYWAATRNPKSVA